MHHCAATCSAPLTETGILGSCTGHKSLELGALLSPVLCCRHRAAHHHAAWRHTVLLVPVPQGLGCHLVQIMHGHPRRGSQNLLAHRDVLHDKAPCLLLTIPVALTAHQRAQTGCSGLWCCLKGRQQHKTRLKCCPQGPDEARPVCWSAYVLLLAGMSSMKSPPQKTSCFPGAQKQQMAAGSPSPSQWSSTPPGELCRLQEPSMLPPCPVLQGAFHPFWWGLLLWPAL